MLILSKGLCEYICHIFVRVYIRVVDYSVFLQISTIVATTVNVLGGRLHDSHGDGSKSSQSVQAD